MQSPFSKRCTSSVLATKPKPYNHSSSQPTVSRQERAGSKLMHIRFRLLTFSSCCNNDMMSEVCRTILGPHQPHPHHPTPELNRIHSTESSMYVERREPRRHFVSPAYSGYITWRFNGLPHLKSNCNTEMLVFCRKVQHLKHRTRLVEPPIYINASPLQKRMQAVLALLPSLLILFRLLHDSDLT